MRFPLIQRCAMVAALLVAALAPLSPAHAQQRAICYNCPPEWADWGSQLKAIQSRLGIQVPPDNKNSGQSIAALIAEKASPVADVVYLGGIAADPARDAGVLTPYKPKGWEKIPADLKDPNGHWFAIHSGTLGFFVNTVLLRTRVDMDTSFRQMLASVRDACMGAFAHHYAGIEALWGAAGVAGVLGVWVRRGR